MLIFKRKMIDRKGKAWNQGQRVPEDFSTPLGLQEMIKAGDIEDNEKKPINSESTAVAIPVLAEPEQVVNQEPEPEQESATAEPEQAKPSRGRGKKAGA